MSEAWPTLPDGRVDVNQVRVFKNRRRYYFHPDFGDEELFVSVTAVTGLWDDPYGLSRWQRGIIAEKWMADPKFPTRKLAEGKDPKRAIVDLADEAGSAAGAHGTFLHDLVERFLTTGLTTEEATEEIRGAFDQGAVPEPYRGGGIANAEKFQPARVVKNLVGKYEQVVKGLEWIRAEPVAVEAVGYNTLAPVKYAGTVDLIARLHPTSPVYEKIGVDGTQNPVTAIVDLKTGNSVRDQYALQLAAYMNADDFRATPSPLEWDRAYTVGLVLHVGPKSFRWLPVAAGPSWDSFRAALAMFVSRQTGAGLFGDRLNGGD